MNVNPGLGQLGEGQACGCELRRGRRIDDLAQEGFEHQQRPQRRTVVAGTRLMGFNKVLQIRALEPAGLCQARA